MRVRQGVRTCLGHGGITCVLQTQFSSFLIILGPGLFTHTFLSNMCMFRIFMVYLGKKNKKGGTVNIR